MTISSDNRVADLYSLRHGFNTYLVTANVPPTVARTLARYSTIKLTANRDTHLGIIDLIHALKRLPTIASGYDNCRSNGD